MIGNTFLLQKLAVSLALVLIASVASVALAQVGADYDLTWSTIDAGGGEASGEDYQLVGSIGQPDAGLMNGGDYTLEGGLWVSSAISPTTPPPSTPPPSPDTDIYLPLIDR